MLEVSVTNTVIDVTITSSDIPAVDIGLGLQGPEGAKGDVGEKGDKGDPLLYSMLTEQEKTEIVAQYDQFVGNTSYANVFLNALLS